MLIGFKDDGLYESADNNFKFLRRGTLSLLSQYLTCKQGQDTSVYIIDDYAIALYDYKANPVLGISPITNKVLNSNVKQISFRLLSDKNAILETHLVLLVMIIHLLHIKMNIIKQQINGTQMES